MNRSCGVRNLRLLNPPVKPGPYDWSLEMPDRYVLVARAVADSLGLTRPSQFSAVEVDRYQASDALWETRTEEATA